MKKFLKISSNVLVILFLAVALTSAVSLIVEAIRGNQPSVFGYKLHYILTDSMEPDIKAGDMILSKTINKVSEVEKLKEGDIVTFLGHHGIQNGKLITHQIILTDAQEGKVIFENEEGKKFIRTKGTNPKATVDEPVPIEHIRAVTVRKMPVLGSLYTFFTSVFGLLILASVVLLSLAVVLFLKFTKPPQAKQPKKKKP
ncbi:MAG: signal peptidase I [Firmicutes bacterium]|nr:signal peptidase I [Bacillota bacterium]